MQIQLQSGTSSSSSSCSKGMNFLNAKCKGWSPRFVKYMLKMHHDHSSQKLTYLAQESVSRQRNVIQLLLESPQDSSSAFAFAQLVTPQWLLKANKTTAKEKCPPQFSAHGASRILDVKVWRWLTCWWVYHGLPMSRALCVCTFA